MNKEAFRQVEALIQKLESLYTPNKHWYQRLVDLKEVSRYCCENYDRMPRVVKWAVSNQLIDCVTRVENKADDMFETHYEEAKGLLEQLGGIVESLLGFEGDASTNELKRFFEASVYFQGDKP